MSAGLHRQGNGSTLIHHAVTVVVSIVGSLALAYFGHFGGTGAQGPAGPAGPAGRSVSASVCAYTGRNTGQCPPGIKTITFKGVHFVVEPGK